MAKNSEGILTRLLVIMKDNRVDIFDALLILCDEDELDPDVIVKSLDSNVLERLKSAAIESRRVLIPQRDKLQFD